MKMLDLIRILKCFILTIAAVIFFTTSSFFSSALAAEDSFVTIVNPVRGYDFWGLKDQEPLTAVIEQLSVIQANNLSATWLLRPDTLFDQDLSRFFKDLPDSQEKGIFLEVTPKWADKAGVDYHQSTLWHYAKSVFLSGYTVEERKKLIDNAFEEFKRIFGFYPKSVGAWHIDAGSLAYMREKYEVAAALICADQFLTDDYQIWGGWWGVPYYPSRYNVLVPAQTAKNKLDVVVLQWAARDPVNGYGGGVEESTFSVQANDYRRHGLGNNYFSKLVDIYLKPVQGEFAQVTIGLENDNPWTVVGEEYEKQIEILAEKDATKVTMAEFSDWYRRKIPDLSPPHQVGGEDLLGSGQKASWIMDTRGRLGILEKEGTKTIRDLRIYNEEWAEPYLEVANASKKLSLSLPAKIDTIRFPDSSVPLAGQPDYLKDKLNLPFATSKIILPLMVAISFLLLFMALRLDRWLLPLVGLGAASQIITMVKSGLLYPFGMGFWGPNGHDGIWHIALINELTRHFPPQNPVFSGSSLVNYHWLFDLGVALFSKITRLPVINLYFQIIPLIFSGLLGILTYIFVQKWTRNRLSALLAVFFVYFGGSFGWLITLWRSGQLGGESLFWANQAISFLINPPYALSILWILLGLIIFLNYLDKPDLKKFAALTFIFGFLVGVKSYAGVVVLFSLLTMTILDVLFCHGGITRRLFFPTVFISGLVFWLMGNRPSSIFVFSPFWFPRTMLSFSDRFYWPQLEQARQAYLATGNWRRYLLAEFLGVLIFFVGNLGTRILFLGKIISWLRKLRKIDFIEAFFLGGLLAGGLIPLFFIQKGNPWNSIQFFYYFLFFAGILAACWLGDFFQKRSPMARIIFLILLILLTIPTTISSLKHYLPYRAPARITYEELEALQFLKNQPEGVVMSFPHDYWAREKAEAPKPLFIYETTAYVSAFSDKPTFLEDEMNLEIMQINWKPRREEVEKFFATTDSTWAREFLKNNKIRYLYLVENQLLSLDPLQFGLEKIFENGQVRIYEFRGKI